MKTKIFSMIVVLVLGYAKAQVNSGSNGSDGALDLSATNGTIYIDMHDHPNGIYQYTYVNIPNSVTLRFIPNANNSPIYWLVQSNVFIVGGIVVDATGGTSGTGGFGGVGGSRGGNPGSMPTDGEGPGGGGAGSDSGGNGSYGEQVRPTLRV
jgi:hypothetical protein